MFYDLPKSMHTQPSYLHTLVLLLRLAQSRDIVGDLVPHLSGLRRSSTRIKEPMTFGQQRTSRPRCAIFACRLSDAQIIAASTKQMAMPNLELPRTTPGQKTG